LFKEALGANRDYAKGSRSVCFAKCFLGGLGHQCRKTTQFQVNVWFFGLGTPGLQQKTLGQKLLRDPFELPPLGLTPPSPLEGGR
jgi:hypothetical protein